MPWEGGGVSNQIVTEPVPIVYKTIIKFVYIYDNTSDAVSDIRNEY